MTHKMEFKNGIGQRVLRSDAERDRDGRWFVPTIRGTKWVSSMAEFVAAGGTICFNGDQTELELLLPEGYKFSVQMFRTERYAQIVSSAEHPDLTRRALDAIDAEARDANPNGDVVIPSHVWDLVQQALGRGVSAAGRWEG